MTTILTEILDNENTTLTAKDIKDNIKNISIDDVLSCTEDKIDKAERVIKMGKKVYTLGATIINFISNFI